MLTSFKRFFLSGTGLLYVTAGILALLLILSFLQIDPGFNPRTSLGRLYANKLITGGLLIVLAGGLTQLHRSKPEERYARSLVFAGILWGLSFASAFGFDMGVFLALSLSATSLYQASKRSQPNLGTTG